jgi:hypothetical protein
VAGKNTGKKNAMATVTGPTSSTDSAIALWDGTSGSVIKDCNVTVRETGGGLFIGPNTGEIVNFGSLNVAFGPSAGSSLVDGDNNTAVGESALLVNDGNGNTAIGKGALATVTGADHNTCVGSQAIAYMSSGSDNTALGYLAGQSLVTGSNNILIGSAVDVPGSTTSNYLNIGGVITGQMNGTAALNIAGNPTTTTQTAGDNSTAVVAEAAQRPRAPFARRVVVRVPMRRR